MADIDTTAAVIASAEERQKRIDEKTSAGRYALKNLKELAVSLAGGAAGYAAAAYGLMKNSRVAGFVQEKLIEHVDVKAAKYAKQAAGAVGAVVGVVISGIVLAYGSWKNKESEKLAVAEINQDVGHLVEQRAKFADTLSRQEAVIKELIAERQAMGGTHRDRAANAEASVASR